MYQTKQKCGFLGYMVAIESTKGVFADWVEPPDSPLKYLLMYKFSQDHLELYFNCMRSAGGSNNNPTAQQFIGTFKRLLLRSSIGGNIFISTPGLLRSYKKFCILVTTVTH